MRILVATTAVAALAAGSALAADLYTPPQVAVPTPVYTTPVRAYDWTGPYAGALVGYGWGAFGAPIGSAPTGFVAGGFVGYNVQAGNVVYGAEMDAAWSGRSDGAGNDVNWTSSFRGRIGYAFGRVLVYGTGGLAVAGVSTAPGPSTSTEIGWTAGGGAEFAITDSLFARAEYLYSSYGAIPDASSLSTQEVRLGIGFRF
ncbi:MAG: porin family protein [Bauldia sp.]|nr:porin family protein [Bauldia sp.]